jgi:AraC-like DNA-binding protein
MEGGYVGWWGVVAGTEKLKEIASRLGYSEAANFRHAFARWIGRSPSDFRGGADA